MRGTRALCGHVKRQGSDWGLVIVPLVLCYHAVSDDWEHPLAVRQATVERQLRKLIESGWKPVHAVEVIAGVSRALHVTFDDGYRSVLQVLPSLERLGVRATIFVCTDYAREGRPLDVPPLDDVPLCDSRELATLCWDELRELAGRGVEIGSHGRTHTDLRDLSASELWREVAESREEIESELGGRCSYFAYPYGQADRRVRGVVERAGYEGAFGLLGVGARGGCFGIPRVELSRGDGYLRTTLKSSPAWRLLAGPLRRMRGPLGRLNTPSETTSADEIEAAATPTPLRTRT
jgi:peptidoglycan/xylan/chitin deacetylase (PgdA/CDA1 family)